MNVYKIYKKSTQKYATAGDFSKTGKTFSTIGNLRLHINCHYDTYKNYQDYEIIAYKTIVDEEDPVNMRDEIKRLVDREIEKAERYAQWNTEYARKQAAEDLKRIKRDFPELFEKEK